jgi:tyrosine-protein phosphatase SIW14
MGRYEKMKSPWIWALTAALSALISLATVPAFADSPLSDPDSPLPNFHTVVPGIWRSARPQETGIEELVKQGLKTVISLDDDATFLSQEAQWASGLKISFDEDTIYPNSAVDPAVVDDALSVMVSSGPESPLLIHCYAGEDRTGMVVGLYRVLVQHWEPADAYKEMLYYGFHPSWAELDQYFRTRTGWNGT